MDVSPILQSLNSLDATLLFEKPNPKTAEEWVAKYKKGLVDVAHQIAEPYQTIALKFSEAILPGLHLLCLLALVQRGDQEYTNAIQALQIHESEMALPVQLPRCQSIKEQLTEVLRHPTAAHLQDAARRMMAFDVQHLAASVSILSTRNLDHLLNQIESHPTAGQDVVDVFQALLDNDDVEDCHSFILKGLLRLSRRTGLFPLSLMTKNVVNTEGSNAVAQGSFGDVWRGWFRGKPIAMKVIRTGRSTADIRVWGREAIVWCQLRHANILPFYGIYTHESHPPAPITIALLSPWMHNGDVINYLSAHPNADRESIIFDTARGLHYLHTFRPPFIHGDIKGNNILITASGRACLADFGLTRIQTNVDDDWRTSASGARGGNILFAAPELFDDNDDDDDDDSPFDRRRKTLESDVYSFACASYEIYNGRPRFSELSFLQTIIAIRGNHKCPKPSFCTSHDLWSWIQDCWDVIPSRRPTISDFLLRFQVEPIPYPDGWNDPGIRLNAFQLDFRKSNPPRLKTGGENLIQVGSTSTIVDSVYSASPRSTVYVRQIQVDHGSFRFRKADVIILLAGADDSGKKTFINHAIGRDITLGTANNDFQLYGCTYPNRSEASRVFFIEAPSKVSPDNTIRLATAWLDTTYSPPVAISGVLYFINIAELNPTERVDTLTWGWRRTCRRGNIFKQILFLSTGWEDDSLPTSDRDRYLREGPLKLPINRGARYLRFRSADRRNAQQLAWDVIDMFDPLPRREPWLFARKLALSFRGHFFGKLSCFCCDLLCLIF